VGLLTDKRVSWSLSLFITILWVLWPAVGWTKSSFLGFNTPCSEEDYSGLCLGLKRLSYSISSHAR